MNDILSESYSTPSSDLIPRVSKDLEQPLVMLDDLRRGERQIAVSSIASMIAHFVGTPLNVIVGRAGLIRRHPDATEAIIKDATCIQQKVDQVTEKLRALIDSLAIPTSAAHCEPDTLVAEAVALYRPIAWARSVELQVTSAAHGAARVKRDPTFVILTSLLSLAIHEVAVGSRIEIRTSPATAAVGSEVQITFVVPGCVFDDPRQLSRFENVPHKSANGLQVLGICAALARNIGGQLRVQASSEVGSELILQWPAAAQFSL